MEVGRQMIDNCGGNANPSIDLTISKSVTDTESFTHYAGHSLAVGTEFKTGIPFSCRRENKSFSHCFIRIFIWKREISYQNKVSHIHVYGSC